MGGHGFWRNMAAEAGPDLAPGGRCRRDGLGGTWSRGGRLVVGVGSGGARAESLDNTRPAQTIRT